jgi:hypothetical protein
LAFLHVESNGESILIAQNAEIEGYTIY